MKKLSLIFIAAIAAISSGCDSGTTLEELSKMSNIERQQLTEIKLNVDLPEGAELNFWKTFEGCTNLTKIEISEDFKGTISGGSRYGGPKHVKTLIAKGATKIGYSCFYAGADNGFNEDLEFVELPSVKDLDLHAFGGSYSTNQIRSLDFPCLMGIGTELAGCRKLTTLKLGYDGPITFYQGFGNSLDTENIDLYLGKYEYENHVEGNLLYPYAYRDAIKGDFSISGNPDIENAESTGKPIKFRSINPYR